MSLAQVVCTCLCTHTLVVFERFGHSFLTVVTLRIDAPLTRTIFEGSSTDVCVSKDIATVRIANFSLTPMEGTANGMHSGPWLSLHSVPHNSSEL